MHTNNNPPTIFATRTARLLALASLVGCLASTACSQVFVSQRNPTWKNDRMGSSSDTIGSTGCAISSVTMAIRSFGRQDITPRTMNQYLTSNRGYVDQDELVWSAPAGIDGAAGFSYWGAGSITSVANLRSTLLAGYRVVASSKRFSEHFVFIVGFVNGGKSGATFSTPIPMTPRTPIEGSETAGLAREVPPTSTSGSIKPETMENQF